MNKKNISPNPQQPIDRVPSGQLPSALAELSEEAIGSLALASSSPCGCYSYSMCSYEGDDE
ncbi:microcyclamide/patellamide family RiPP [Arthrospira sp. O9.13F]|nr:microcyclamide/patellamide family RiPP [Arthrospira sp. O9.13F]